MPELKHFAPDAVLDEMLASIQEYGAIILDKLISSDCVDAIRSETDPYMEATSNGIVVFA